MLASGATVIAIEHDLDVMSRADWIIDLGPGAGRDGGGVDALTSRDVLSDLAG